MGAGQSDLGIANLAMIDLGQPALVTGNEDSKAGRIYRAQFEQTVKEILRSHPWRCARRRVILTPDASHQPPFGFAYAAPLPADFVKVIKFNNNIDKFKVTGPYLESDDDGPELTYVARVPTAEFDALLVSSIAARLAWRWCMPLTDSANAAKEYRQAFSDIFADAKFADALDGAPEEPPIGTWAVARMTG